MKKIEYVLGVDQSTQGTKAILMDKEGKIIARAAMPHKQLIHSKGWISHDPKEIYHNVIAVCALVIEKAQIDKNFIQCIGITNQRETTVVWNKETGEPISDAIVWHCNRAKDICSRIEKEKEAGSFIYKRTGLKISPYYPAAKIAWYMENINGIKELIESKKLAFGTVDSWLIYKLSGNMVHKTDYSNASRTQLFDIDTCKWSEEICNIFQIPMDALPQVCDSDSVFTETDLDGILERKIPVCGILGDSHGALFGHNCHRKGSIKATYGTGSSVMLNTGNEHIYSRHGISASLAWKIKGEVSYVLEGNINYTGAVISWLKDDLGMLSSINEINELIKKANEDDETYIVPAFSGLGAPWWNSSARASFIGMCRTTGRAEIVKAACECIVYQINDVVEAMRKDTELKIKSLCVDGGPTRNPYIMQFQSDITSTEVLIPDTEELSVIGVAYLAGITKRIFDESIFQSISYTQYHPEMGDKRRQRKLNGWNEAVAMLNSNSKGEK